ncbi:MAG TPA: hypothetical protein VFC19_24830 [Candidatus Limnocylindrales bacterium]|nr:hypothetical protein [Candidatus Limnocylindrales bacterium]
MARHSLRSLGLWLLAAAAVITAIALASPGRSATDHDHDDHPHLDLHNGLLVSTRTVLRICVQPGDHRPAIESSVLGALDEVRRHPYWRAAYGRAQYARSTVLAWGCPAPRLPERYEPKGTVAGPGVTAEPSPYRVWLYVLDEPTADRVLGPDRDAGTASAEFMRDSAGAFPVSTALLVRERRLADTAALARDLSTALGLGTQ